MILITGKTYISQIILNKKERKGVKDPYILLVGVETGTINLGHNFQ